VFDVYKDASMPREWIPELAEECRIAGVEFMSTPYDVDALGALHPFVPAYKIGSGDITWLSFLREIAAEARLCERPVILSTGASTLDEVVRAMSVFSGPLVLMQCSTVYDGNDAANLRHINLRVLETYRHLWPHVVLGLSDHTKSIAPILGAVTLGARVIERHFTDDNRREGPDHRFSMTPHSWRDMVDRTRELEMALGSPIKRVCDNERETVIVQRRAIRATRDINAGEVIHDHDIAYLRPCPPDAIPASEDITGRRAQRVITKGNAIRWGDLE
jgi:N-acetylneuraminate synthase